MSTKAWDCQSSEPDEGRDIGNFQHPESETVFAEMLLDAINHGVALSPA